MTCFARARKRGKKRIADISPWGAILVDDTPGRLEEIWSFRDSGLLFHFDIAHEQSNAGRSTLLLETGPRTFLLVQLHFGGISFVTLEIKAPLSLTVTPWVLPPFLRGFLRGSFEEATGLSCSQTANPKPMRFHIPSQDHERDCSLTHKANAPKLDAGKTNSPLIINTNHLDQRFLFQFSVVWVSSVTGSLSRGNQVAI